MTIEEDDAMIGFIPSASASSTPCCWRHEEKGSIDPAARADSTHPPSFILYIFIYLFIYIYKVSVLCV